MLVINFKAYKEASGANALKLAKRCGRVSKKIFLAVQTADIAEVAKKVRNPVIAQHCDYADYGANTGSILPEAIKAAGAKGSLLNHSEKKIPLIDVIKTVRRLRKLGLISIVCAESPAEAYKLYQARPDFIAIEPPELIGTRTSVSEARPQSIVKTAKLGIPILCGAGIHNKQDVRKAYELGAKGILVSSAVVLAKRPDKVVKDLVSA